MPLTDYQQEMIENLRTDIHDIRDLLTGGNEPERGMIVKVDRLVQMEERRRWIVKTALGGAISAVGLALWGLIKKT